MSAAANNVLSNFRWRIESITPTATRPGKGFKFVDPLRLDPDVSTGTARNFSVYWENSEADLEPSDMMVRFADHTYLVEISYPASKFKIDDLQEIILQDRHDIIKAIHNPSSYVGIDANSTTASIGLHARHRLEDSLSREGESTWYFRQRWRCTIQEDE
jgi:hypothetical protein